MPTGTTRNEPRRTPPDPEAADAEIVRRASALLRLARGLVRDPGEADDVLQQSALLALEGRVGSGRAPAAFWGGVIRNLVRHRARAAARQKEHERRAARPDATSSVLDAVARVDLHRRILDEVRALEEPYRTVLVLRYLEGLWPRAIATRLGLPLETVKSRLKRGLSTLRRRLDAGSEGSRMRWLGALGPVVRRHGRGPAVRAVLGGVMTSKLVLRISGALAVLLLLGGGGYVVGRALSRPEPPAPPGLLEGTAPARAAPPPATLAAGAGTAPSSPTPIDGAALPAAIGTPGSARGVDGREAGFVPTPFDRAAFESARPAVVASPFGPPPGGTALGKGGGGMGPTGHWTRFSLPPPRGPARLSVRVLDENGRPLSGTEVFLGPPGAVGAKAVSFGDLRTLGATGPDGVLAVADLPAGAAAVLANHHDLGNGPRGLDGTPSVPVLLSEGEEARVVVRLPVDGNALGAVRGVVWDEQDRPIASAAVTTSFRRVWSDAGGRFTLEGLPAGPTNVSVGAVGRAGSRVVVDVPRGGAADVTVHLAFAERGRLRIQGSAELADGTPVASGDVYLIDVARGGTLRHAATDENGSFELLDLPDRLETSPVRVQVSGEPRYRTGVLELPDGVRDERVKVVLPGALARVELALTDRDSGEPIRIAEVLVRPEGAERPAVFVYDARRGVWFASGPPGRATLTVQTLTHGGFERVLDLVEAPDPMRLEVPLVRQAPDPVTIALDVRVLSSRDGRPVGKVRIEVADATGDTALATFEGARADGRYRLPAPSGARRLRVEADGYEATVLSVELDPSPLERAVDVRLRPRP